MLHVKLLEKQVQAKLKSSRRKEIIKTKSKINEIEVQNTKQRINETQSWFFEKINKIDHPLAYLTKMRRENSQISKIRNKKGKITINTREIQGIIRNYFENLYSNKVENLEETDKFLDAYDHLKLNQKNIYHLNRSITHKKLKQ
jgi:hypothetical protein